MSGIYIKGMGMPKKGCIKMLILLDGGHVIETTPGCKPQPEEQNYTAVFVPDHGRLIDGDVLGDMLEKYKKEYALKAKGDIVHLHKAWGLYDAELMAESLPTIIPADKEV